MTNIELQALLRELPDDLPVFFKGWGDSRESIDDAMLASYEELDNFDYEKIPCIYLY